MTLDKDLRELLVDCKVHLNCILSDSWLVERIDAALAEPGTSDDALDAARYRWLRHGDNDEGMIGYYGVEPTPFLLRHKRLDVAIDTAMAREKLEHQHVKRVSQEKDDAIQDALGLPHIPRKGK